MLTMWNNILLADNVLMLWAVTSGMGMQSTRACFSNDKCNRHILNRCDMMQKIAIIDAYYTNNKECAKQCPQNISSIPEDVRITPLENMQLQKVDNSCTYQQSCSSRAQRSTQFQTFSVLEYLCIDGHANLDMCNGQSKPGCDVAIMFHHKEHCTCYITRETDVIPGWLEFYLLSMNSTTICNTLGIHINGEKKPYSCNSSVTPYRLLVRSKLQGNDSTWITVKNTRKSRIWIQVKGLKSFRVTCRRDWINLPVPPMSERFTATCSHDATKPTVPRPASIDDSSTGAIVGGAVAAILVTIGVVLLLLCFKCKRKMGTESKHSVGQTRDDRNSLATPISDNNYHETEAPGTNKMGSNYDYAIVDDEPRLSEKLQSPRYEDDYDHIGDNPLTNTGDYDTTLTVVLPLNDKTSAVNEDDYNYDHLATGKNKDEVINAPDYDTAASASEAVQQMRTMDVSDMDNYFGYNHVDNSPQKHLKGEYDTTASAAKAVSQMLEEKDYDHVPQMKPGVQASDAPYDITVNLAGHTEDYSAAGVVQKHDPYDLAK